MTAISLFQRSTRETAFDLFQRSTCELAEGDRVAAARSLAEAIAQIDRYGVDAHMRKDILDLLTTILNNNEHHE